MLSKLGWKKDKFDKRDYLHTPLKAIPNSFIIKNIPAVRDQGDEGSCVGFGLGANLTILAKVINIDAEWFSPRWIYNGARYIEGTLKTDSGAYPKDGLDWLRAKGSLLEHFWPYIANVDLTKSPPSVLNPEAAKYPLIAYYRVTGGTNSICSAISQGYPVSIGTPWFEKWMDPPTTGKLASVNKNDYVAGGHETCLYGYDIKAGYFYGINSWGTSWGKAGLYLMPMKAFSVFGSLGGYDAHYISVNWAPTPAPDPTPTPEPTSIIHRIRVQDSVDGGTSWTTLIEKELS